MTLGNERSISAFGKKYDHSERHDPRHERDRIRGERDIAKPDAAGEKHDAHDIEQVTVGLLRLGRVAAGNDERDDAAGFFAANPARAHV